MFYKCALLLTPVESKKVIYEGIFILDSNFLLGLSLLLRASLQWFLS